MELGSILPAIQILLGVVLIAAILLQKSGAGIGGAFGGSDSGSVNHTRRGAERTLFQATIVLGVLFTLSVAIPLLTIS